STRSVCPRDRHSFPTRRSSDLITSTPTDSGRVMRTSHFLLGLRLRPVVASIVMLATTAVGARAQIVVNTFETHVRATRDSVSARSEEHTSELQSRENLVCRLLL